MDDRARKLFNSEYFSIYDGIVESIDSKTGLMDIRVPELNNTLFNECRALSLCASSTVSVNIPYPIGTSVIIGFKQFNLAFPVVLGQIKMAGQANPYQDNSVSIAIGNSNVTITPTTITFACGSSKILMTENSIQLIGTVITANGEDLTVDEVSDDSGKATDASASYLGYGD